jgi:hypothetical protein
MLIAFPLILLHEDTAEQMAEGWTTSLISSVFTVVLEAAGHRLTSPSKKCILY